MSFLGNALILDLKIRRNSFLYITNIYCEFIRCQNVMWTNEQVDLWNQLKPIFSHIVRNKMWMSNYLIKFSLGKWFVVFWLWSGSKNMTTSYCCHASNTSKFKWEHLALVVVSENCINLGETGILADLQPSWFVTISPQAKQDSLITSPSMTRVEEAIMDLAALLLKSSISKGEVLMEK